MDAETDSPAAAVCWIETGGKQPATRSTLKAEQHCMPKPSANHYKEYCFIRATSQSRTAPTTTTCILSLPAHHCRLCQKPALLTLPNRVWAAPWAAMQGQVIISVTIFVLAKLLGGLRLLSLSSSCRPAAKVSPPEGYLGRPEASQQAHPPAGQPGSQAAKLPNRPDSQWTSQPAKQAGSQPASKPPRQPASI